MRELLDRFVSAIDAEIALIERETRDQSHELLSGQQDEKSTGTLYIFVLADALRLPEDASGTLQFSATQCSAMVVAQEGNRIWLLLESLEPLPAYIPSARLVLNETELLRRLKEKTEALRSTGNLGLAPKVFGYEDSKVSNAGAPTFDSAQLDPATKKVLEQCIGSDVTFLWGPPGTGKTFTIAALVASLTAVGETALVTSHTHAAVEQALWALIKPPSDDRGKGLLFESPLVNEGRILKVGPLLNKSGKIPRCVHLDSYLEDKAKERDENIRILEEERERVSSLAATIREQMRPWHELNEVEATYNRLAEEHSTASETHERSVRAVDEAKRRLAENESLRVQAERSFIIGRRGRVERAAAAVAVARAELMRTQATAGATEARLIRVRARLADTQAEVIQAQRATLGSRTLEELEIDLASALRRIDSLQSEIEALRLAAEEDANQLVRNALALFVTLTKLYIDRDTLKDLTWDTVIIDEVSMAMPPLVAYAAARARKRVVVVGDPYQLPPVVQSEPDSEGGLLGKDVFELREITSLIENRGEFRSLAKLRTQRRMHPDIAAVAKELIDVGYADLENHPDTLKRAFPAFASALGTDSALVAVDISAFHPWSGKMRGSLSRFNFLSGQVAVELAALYAAGLTKPDATAPRPIGIVTPYAAQRRYLNRLVHVLQLDRWVAAGTVHTFQGDECDVIIFDSVLGEPHWTARLTNPHTFKEVRRDLNVAVTRARHQFVFVGDSHWLKKNAKAGSGYGKLWNYLEKQAIHMEAPGLVSEGFRSRLAQTLSQIEGWKLTEPGSVALFTETDFYPRFETDLNQARERVILYTAFIGKTRWPLVEPHIAALRERGVDVYILHKPLSDPEWRKGDRGFGEKVFEGLSDMGIKLIPMSGAHPKTIVIDSQIVYDGSLNWASQTASYEHMWRFDNKDMAALIERMLQLEPIVKAFSQEKVGDRCPNCGGKLILINQAQQTLRDVCPMKLGCYNHAEDKKSCVGYLRCVDGRPPFVEPPLCERGVRMNLHYTQSGRPWDWRCGHNGCRTIRWTRGDCLK